ncbi:MAG: nucleotidyltransferase domain-containing protein [Lachnospiraceae bacterium]
MAEELINIVTSEVVNQAVEIIKDDIYKIYLYGSYARGDDTSESDIDIMIVLRCDKDKVKSYRKQVSRLASRIGLENDVEVSLLLRDKESFEAGQKILPFYQNVTREGVTIYG